MKLVEKYLPKKITHGERVIFWAGTKKKSGYVMSYNTVDRTYRIAGDDGNHYNFVNPANVKREK